MNKICVGIIGYGVVGTRRHHFLNKNEKFKVVAVCDKNFKHHGKLDDGTKFYPDYRSLLNSEQLDAIFVCITNDIAPEVTMAGLKSGLHVFCEKPPGRNVEDVLNVREVENSHPGLKLKYGFNHRYHDSIIETQNLIQSKVLGEVINARGIYGKSMILNFEGCWRSKKEIAGGGILLDQGIHMIDLMRLFCGEMKEIKSYVTNNFWNYNVEDNAYSLMKSDRNVVCMLHSTATEWRHRFELTIGLTKGTVILSGILSGSKSYGQESLTVVYRGENDNGNPKEQRTTYIVDHSWEREIEEFADCIVNNLDVKFGTSMDALKSMEAVRDIYANDPGWNALQRNI